MNRQEDVLKRVRGKRVLDVGGINHKIETEKSDRWLHKQIAKEADYVVGVDISKEEVIKAQELGYNFIYGDAEHLDEYVDEKFDVCVAGELIEHLANPGLFLGSVSKVLKKDGIIILTTPNAFAVGNILRILKYMVQRKVRKDNPEHKAWYDMPLLEQVLQSEGFEVVELRTIRPDREASLLNTLKYKLYGNANSKIFCVAQNT